MKFSTKDKFISIIILNYNNISDTLNCIKSIYEKESKLNFEIIVVDNASNNQEELDSILDKINHCNIKLIKNKINKGFAAGCNDGIKIAEGEYILLLNNDTVLLNDAITKVYNFLEVHPEIAFATCKVLNKDGTPQGVCKSFFRIRNILYELFRLNKIMPYKITSKILWGSFFRYDEIAYPDWIAGTFMMFKKEILNIFPNNKLPETFWMYYEDMEWCWLAKKNGYKIAFVPSGVIIHFSNLEYNKYRNEMLNNNLKFFFTLYYNKFYCKLLFFLFKILLTSRIS